MTLRLYYDDPYCTRFAARVVERLDWEGHPALVLDRTAFYPTGGGQPHDSGWLDGIPVIDVVEREENGSVIHVLAGPLDASELEGRIDWQRRFDLMQQHTGQHILSAAALERLSANTIGFHLSDEYATIDLDRAPLTTAELAEAESLANAIVFEDRATLSRFVTDEEVPRLRLRKPVHHAGPIRIVEISDFDCSACGGTHVRTTGEVGLVKITRSERRGAETRVEFLCGRRAVKDYGLKNSLLMGLASEFTVGHWEVPDLVHHMAEELQGMRRELRLSRDALLDAEAVALWHQASAIGKVRVVQSNLAGRGPDHLKHLAQRLVVHPCTLALLGSGAEGDEKGFLVFARSADVDVHMGALIQQACEAIGGRGGGRPEFAQGGGPDGAKVVHALGVAVQQLIDSLGTVGSP